MVGGPVACAFCGKVRSEKVEVEVDGVKEKVCKKHILLYNGQLANRHTVDAIARIWRTSSK